MRKARWTAGWWLAATAGCISPPISRVDPLLAPRMGGPVATASASSPFAPRSEPHAADPHAAWRPATGLSVRWNSIVIHHSGTQTGGAERLDTYHAAPRSRGGLGLDELAWHFVIGNGTDTTDGEIEPGPRWRKQKPAARCSGNETVSHDGSIGICLVGDFDTTRPSEKQMDALAELVRFLLTACRISATQIDTHQEPAALADCPGTRFVLAELNRRLASTQLASTRP